MRARTLAAIVAAASALAGGTDVQTLKATGGLPAHIVAKFGEPIGYVEASNGDAIVLDRRAHMVYSVNRARTAVRTIVNVGLEKGAVVTPGALAMADNDIAIVGMAGRFPGARNIDEFWANLQEGYDLFERDRVPPGVRVRGGRYVFAPA